MKLRRSLVLLFASATIVILAFQNCSEVSLVSPTEVIVAASIEKVSDNYCAPTGASFSNPTKVTFIVDMSASNLGVLNSTQTGEWHDPYIWAYDFTGAADLEGQRFKAIKQFINSCGSASNLKYAVVGFGRHEVFGESESCVSSFVDQESALRSVAGLEKMQSLDKGNPSRWAGPQNPFNMQTATSYEAAMNCLNDKVGEDVTYINNEVPIYHSFFLTDGMDTGRADKRTDVINQLKSIKRNALSGGAAEFNFHPLYYSSPGAANQGAQKADAMSFLDLLAKAVNPATSAGELNSISALDDLICDSLQPEIQSDFSLSSAYAVNLTAKMRGASLFADTDMDGLLDSEELALGFDPQNSHTNKIIDALCASDKAACESADLKCSGVKVSLGLTDCDIEYLDKKYNIRTKGADHDSDTINDYIEIIRGTALARADAIENISGDNISNFKKIAAGMDIHTNYKQVVVPEKNKIKMAIALSTDTCENNKKSYTYVFDYLPAVDVGAYQDPRPEMFDLSHAENENVYMVFTVWSPEGGADLPSKLYGQKILANQKGSVVYGELKFIGELSQ